MFERFTDDARSVLVDTQLQARRLGHNFLGCEHLLLAVASSAAPVAEVLQDFGVTSGAVEGAVSRLLGSPSPAIDRDALAAIGIDLDLVRSTIEATFGPEAWRRPAARRHARWRRRRACEGGPGHMPFTARAKQCLELALREAQQLGHSHIGVEHLALALTSMTDGLAPPIFSAIGVSPAQLRARILDRYRLAG